MADAKDMLLEVPTVVFRNTNTLPWKAYRDRKVSKQWQTCELKKTPQSRGQAAVIKR
jgi:hypothetical protein